MIADFVANFAQLIATHPEDVKVEIQEGDEVTEILLFANQADVILNVRSNVQGMLWEIPEEYIDMVTAYERHDNKRQLMINHDNNTMRAWVSYKRPESIPHQPSWDYWQDLESAYTEAGLPLDTLVRATELTDYYINLNQNF